MPKLSDGRIPRFVNVLDPNASGSARIFPRKRPPHNAINNISGVKPFSYRPCRIFYGGTFLSNYPFGASVIKFLLSPLSTLYASFGKCFAAVTAFVGKPVTINRHTSRGALPQGEQITRQNL